MQRKLFLVLGKYLRCLLFWKESERDNNICSTSTTASQTLCLFIYFSDIDKEKSTSFTSQKNILCFSYLCLNNPNSGKCCAFYERDSLLLFFAKEQIAQFNMLLCLCVLTHSVKTISIECNYLMYWKQTAQNYCYERKSNESIILIIKRLFIWQH